MSLNGLDNAQVTEAYRSALTEAGGWFLLKYVTRDEIELLKRGTGGVTEAKEAVAQYAEISPLYGFLLYRRRKVLIKYMPEGTSRLLQARVTVQFQDVVEKFSPHDTVFDINSATDLNDTALASACSLHTATPASVSSSASSSGSTKRRKLDEITEDAEEAPTRDSLTDTTSIGHLSVPHVVNPEIKHGLRASDVNSTQELIDRLPLPPPSPTSIPQMTLRAASPSASITKDHATLSGYAASIASTTNHDYITEERRFSIQSGRPSVSESYHGYKPKVKLGPRPSLDKHGRPHTSASLGGLKEARPVSSLPSGLRASARKAGTGRPESPNSKSPLGIVVPPPPPIPETPPTSVFTSARPSSSPASVKSLPANMSRSMGMTPEKQRLMRAVELRKKQMSSARSKDVATPQVDTSEKQPTIVVSETPLETEVPELRNPSRASGDHVKVNSGVEVVSTPQPDVDEDSPSTAFTSSPTSAKAPSDGVSTRPSSISETSDHEALADTKIKPPLNQDVGELTNHTEVPADIEDGSHSITLTAHGAISKQSLLQNDSTPTVSKAVKNEDEEEEEEEEEENARCKRSSMISNHSAAGPQHAQSDIDTKKKRRAWIEPLHIDVSGDNSELDYLSDDSFMEELQSATVQEAKPMSVSKSPITPFFPRRPSAQSIMLHKSGSVSNPKKREEDGRLTPDYFSGDIARSASARCPSTAVQREDPMAIVKKMNVSSGISQRIKALAENSHRDSAPNTPPITPPITSDTASSLVALRKSSLHTSPAKPSPTLRSPNRFSKTSISSLQASSLEMNPSVLSASLQPQNRVQTVYNVRQGPTKIESVSVTARIIRDPRTEKPDLKMPTDSTPLELHESPIIIDHHKVDIPVSISTHRPSKSESTPILPPPSSLSQEVSSAPQQLPRPSSELSWRSFGRRKSEAMSPLPPSSRSMSNSSLVSSDTIDEKKEEKRSSRTSRLFKRMSNSLGAASRKSLVQVMISPAENEEQHPPPAELTAVRREPPRAIVVGDLNVQFPDTLLWKRRFVEVDGQGNLVLSLSKANEHPRGITKRYHMSEFRAPFIPDQERQEMPNSVMFDFVDGRSLQCACEDSAGQVHVLKMLHASHADWMAYEQ